jgi:UDP-N-acetylglucosamine--N-acetylmuramyl-(pentapeptide) pyrophosphoryl-undecaprenol N-acetylglucosamine transferase
MAELRPRVVVNVGGYASFPMSFVAKRHGVPLVVVSYDRRPGLVSRLMGRRAAVCAVAFEGSPLPNKVVTGAPMRAEMVTLDRAARRAAARRELGLPQDRFVVAVMCGSLGAQQVNEVIGELVDRWSHRADIAVYHVVGERFVAEARPEHTGSQGIMYAVKGYERRMADLYAAADLLVTRGGAGTISELAAVGAPAVIVPWPGAAGNHQLDNARTLSDHGAAITIEQSQLDVDRLAAEIDRLQRDPVALAAIASAAYAQGARHRDGSLVDVVERVAR